MVIARVVHPETTILRQMVLFVSAAHKKVRKAKHPKQTTNEERRMAIEVLPRRDMSPGRSLRGRLRLLS